MGAKVTQVPAKIEAVPSMVFPSSQEGKVAPQGSVSVPEPVTAVDVDKLETHGEVGVQQEVAESVGNVWEAATEVPKPVTAVEVPEVAVEVMGNELERVVQPQEEIHSKVDPKRR